MEAAAAVRSALPALLGARLPGRPLSDQQLLADAEAWELLGRLVDARRAAAAAEVEWRSRPALSGDGLASRLEVRDGAGLLAERLLISTREAKRRVTLGAALAPQYSLTFEELPARLPATAAAFAAGRLPADSARLIADTLRSVRRRAIPQELALAEQALAETGQTSPADEVEVHCAVWAMRLDPDGAEPAEAEQQRKRAFRLGRLGADGTAPMSGRVSTEDHAVLAGALNAHRRRIAWQRNPDDGEDLDWHEAEGDERSKAQYDYDVFFSLLRAGIRSEQDGSADSLQSPHEVITVITAEQLERRQGDGHPVGVLGRFSVPTVERLQCGGHSRLLVTGRGGEPLWLGRAVRLFSPAQRKALAAQYGGCGWNGCTAPRGWCDAHHIAWYRRDGGRTDIRNGVLLCSYHHHLIHTTKRWQIRLHEGHPHLVPTDWQGPPLPRHRMQQHPARLAVAEAPRRM